MWGKHLQISEKDTDQKQHVSLFSHACPDPLYKKGRTQRNPSLGSTLKSPVTSSPPRVISEDLKWPFPWLGQKKTKDCLSFPHPLHKVPHSRTCPCFPSSTPLLPAVNACFNSDSTKYEQWSVFDKTALWLLYNLSLLLCSNNCSQELWGFPFLSSSTLTPCGLPPLKVKGPSSLPPSLHHIGFRYASCCSKEILYFFLM